MRVSFFTSNLIIIPFLLLAAVLIGGAAAPTFTQTPLKELNYDWYYRWGDSEDSEWRRHNHVGKPLSASSDIVWMRTELPEGDWTNPSIYVKKIYQCFEVYQGETLIYEYGEFHDTSGKYGGFFPLHVIPLKKSLEDPIYFRIFSNDKSRIGISKDIFVGNQKDIFGKILEEGLAAFSIGAILIFAGLFFVLLYYVGRREPVYPVFSCHAIFSGLFSISLSRINQVVFNEPLFWSYVLVLCIFPLPALEFMIIEKLFGPGKKNIIRILWQVNLLLATALIIWVLTSPNFLTPAFKFFEIYNLIVFLIQIVIVAKILSVNKDGKIFALGYTGLLLFSFLDILQDLKFINGSTYIAPWGNLIHLSAIALILSMRVREVQVSATIDGLTGLYNRKYFFDLAAAELERTRRYKRPLSLIILDIDCFKDINDTYGHAFGDEVLKAVAQRCKAILRNVDIIARYGGDEFTILLPETDLENACFVAEKVRKRIVSQPINIGNKMPVNLTISVGVSSADQGVENIDGLFKKADQALYLAKEEGRNNVQTF